MRSIGFPTFRLLAVNPSRTFGLSLDAPMTPELDHAFDRPFTMVSGEFKVCPTGPYTPGETPSYRITATKQWTVFRPE